MLGLLRRLPQGALSRLTGRLAEVRVPGPLRRPVLGAFASLLGLRMSEAELSLDEYPSIAALFVRRLREGARPIEEDEGALLSPVDGIVGEVGTLEWGRLVQAKGQDYTAAALLDDAAAAERYAAGTFITIYLSPRHYHRIHAPCAGTVAEARHVPGALMPVNRPSLLLTPELFPRNERLTALVEGPLGLVALVAVGAFNVGRISAAFDATWNEPTGAVTNRPGRLEPETRRYDPPRRVGQGDEFMAFHLGSTVVLLLEPGRVEVLPELIPGVEVRVGQCMARAVGYHDRHTQPGASS